MQVEYAPAASKQFSRLNKPMQSRIKKYMSEIAFAEGEAKGIARGFADGARRKALEDAGNFKRLGVSVDIIAQATGLSKQEVENV